MKKNVGNTDKIVRIIIAIIVTALYFTGIIPGTLGIVLMIVAGILVATSLISFCPLYFIFKIKSCKTKAE